MPRNVKQKSENLNRLIITLDTLTICCKNLHYAITLIHANMKMKNLRHILMMASLTGFIQVKVNISPSLRKTNTNYNNVEFRINWLFKETRYFVINWSFLIRRFDLIRLLIREVLSNNFLSLENWTNVSQTKFLHQKSWRVRSEEETIAYRILTIECSDPIY